MAGILAMEPEYLILDEPVAGMDAPGKRMLFQLLHHLNKDKGITIVLVSHNMDDVAAHADRVLFGTAGIKVLSSKDAKKVYTSCTAAFLRAKECVMNTVSTVQENAGDIYAGAKEINEERAAKAEAEAFADAEAEAAEKTETAENTEE